MMILKTSRASLSTGGLHPLAVAYTNAVETAGATITTAQKLAISAFFKSGARDGWLSSMKRLYLPIWAAAAPNAVGLINSTSGTFTAGGITHAAGYVQGNGSTGYFDFGTKMADDGLSFDNGLLFSLCYQASGLTGSYLGTINGANTQLIRNVSSTVIQGRYTGNNTVLNGGNIMTGVFTLCSQASNLRSFRRRSSTGAVSLATSSTETASFSLANFNCYAMARNSAGALNEPSNARFGSFGYSLKMTDAQTDLFSLALKNLWETSTGLTLP
jgi:hypothetical protein